MQDRNVKKMNKYLKIFRFSKFNPYDELIMNIDFKIKNENKIKINTVIKYLEKCSILNFLFKKFEKLKIINNNKIDLVKYTIK
jgi:hypothetical protein